jgi:hypothetical protein
MGAIVRIVYAGWILGFLALALVASSQLIFAPTGENRLARWLSQLSLAALWPLAIITRSGREVLRARFRT